MKIIDLIKSEFIKNYTFKKILLVILVLIISVVGIVSFEEILLSPNSSFVESELSYFEDEYKVYNQSPSQDNLKNEWYQFYYKKNIDIYSLIKSDKKYKNVNSDSWQMMVARNIIIVDELNFWVDKYLENKNIDTNLLNENYDFRAMFDDYLKNFATMEDIELIEFKEKLKVYKSKLDALLKENKFYKYVEFCMEQKDSDSDSILTLDSKFIYSDEKIVDNILKNKIEDENDYRVKNIYQKLDMMTSSYNSDRVNEIVDNKQKEFDTILDYSIKNNKKQDITYGGIEVPANAKSINTKTLVNLILPLSIIVMILVVITSGDIVSKEHNKGTEKLLLTSSNKRWKIHFSKFAYLIMHTYIIWFTAFFLFCIYAGLRFGFDDLFTPKLIYQGGNVIEVNYLLYTIKQIFYCSIPVISMISILFMLSTITLNTTITIGISTILVMISPFLWHFIQLLHLKIVAYTPIPYFMFSQVINLNEGYLKTMDICNISESYGIIISVITIIICYLVSNYVYTKRDIKN